MKSTHLELECRRARGEAVHDAHKFPRSAAPRAISTAVAQLAVVLPDATQRIDGEADVRAPRVLRVAATEQIASAEPRAVLHDDPPEQRLRDVISRHGTKYTQSNSRTE